MLLILLTGLVSVILKSCLLKVKKKQKIGGRRARSQSNLYSLINKCVILFKYAMKKWEMSFLNGRKFIFNRVKFASWLQKHGRELLSLMFNHCNCICWLISLVMFFVTILQNLGRKWDKMLVEIKWRDLQIKQWRLSGRWLLLALIGGKMRKKINHRYTSVLLF